MGLLFTSEEIGLANLCRSLWWSSMAEKFQVVVIYRKKLWLVVPACASQSLVNTFTWTRGKFTVPESDLRKDLAFPSPEELDSLI